jgi:hypothetical protein
MDRSEIRKEAESLIWTLAVSGRVRRRMT